MGSRSDHGLAQAAAQALQTAADAVVELDAAIAQGNAAEQRGIGAAGQADGLAGQRLEPGAQGLALCTVRWTDSHQVDREPDENGCKNPRNKGRRR